MFRRMLPSRLRAWTRRLGLGEEPRPHSPHRYSYNFRPPQLCFLCACLEEVRDLPGNFAEVGCARGHTAVFLNHYMSDRGIEKRYFAIDTFGGFVAEDVRYEVEQRGKAPGMIAGFENNKQEWFDETLRANGIARVTSIRADVNELDLGSLGPLAFCLLDVDLYRPMSKALRELFAALVPGGILIADDCDSANPRWDGAEQAYREFCAREGFPYRVVHGKLGVIRKPA
jgi:SAM-dependent methyltransferase